jgi:hypothetical protein
MFNNCAKAVRMNHFIWLLFCVPTIQGGDSTSNNDKTKNVAVLVKEILQRR